ncbi:MULTISPECIES: hypothetical protein, partial [unclassified Granulicatella]
TQDDIITELGRIYAKEYPTLLENKDRQGFYLYTKLKNAGAIVLLSGDNDVNTPIELVIFYVDELGAERHISVTSKSDEQILAWLTVFREVNDWKEPDGP